MLGPVTAFAVGPRRATLAVVAFLVAGCLSPGSATAGWQERFRGFYLGDAARAQGGVVLDGRVWRLGSRGASRYSVYSRSVTGEDAVEFDLDIGALTPPPPEDPGGAPVTSFGADTYGIRDGRVVTTGAWGVPRESSAPSGLGDENTLAAFDGRTGRLVSEQRLPKLSTGDGSTRDVPLRIAAGDPALVSPNPPFGDSSRLFVPFSMDEVGARYPIRGRFVAGDRILGFPDGGGEGAWARGEGPAEVADLETGEERFTVPRYRLLRASRGGEDAKPRMDLSFDGLAQTGVGVRRTRRLVPVAVDTRGRPGRVGRSIPNLEWVFAMRGHGRAFVYLEGSRRVRGERRSCRGLWMTNTAGTRGRRLALGDGATDRQGLPDAWDGRAGVWFGRDSRDRTGVHVDTALHRLKLRRSDLPRCR